MVDNIINKNCSYDDLLKVLTHDINFVSIKIDTLHNEQVDYTDGKSRIINNRVDILEQRINSLYTHCNQLSREIYKNNLPKNDSSLTIDVVCFFIFILAIINCIQI